MTNNNSDDNYSALVYFPDKNRIITIIIPQDQREEHIIGILQDDPNQYMTLTKREDGNYLLVNKPLNVDFIPNYDPDSDYYAIVYANKNEAIEKFKEIRKLYLKYQLKIITDLAKEFIDEYKSL